MTSSSRALELFLQRPTDSNRIDWLANQLLTLAAESQPFSLRLVPGEEGRAWVLEAADTDERVYTHEPGAVRVFRTVLARLAKLAEQETGSPFRPYGGEFHFERAGPVRVLVEVSNGGNGCSLKMSRSAAPAETFYDRAKGEAGRPSAPITPVAPPS